MNDIEPYKARIAELEEALNQAQESLLNESLQRQKNEDKNVGLSDRFQNLLSILPAGRQSGGSESSG